jgi:3-methylfumaryl-CoA hydratase
MSDDDTTWIGRRTQAEERLDPARAQALLAALGRPEPVHDGDALPLLSHWLHFWEALEPARLGPDGHAARGGFLPPVDASRRRMWAGGRVRFLQPLHAGERARKVSTILDVQDKTGRSGPLTFVTVLHEVFGEGGLAVREEHDIVYRARSAPGTPAPEPPSEPRSEPRSEPASPVDEPPADFSERILPNPVLLFRYSALTLNGHRIHYDHPYATGVEGYAGLVVHGPLQATLLLHLAARHRPAPITGFTYRGLSPAVDGVPLDLFGRADGALWSVQAGRRTTAAQATCAKD